MSKSIALLLVVAGAYFVIRGPLRFMERDIQSVDFNGPYLGARAWVAGLDPYRADTYWAEWAAAGGAAPSHPDDFDARTAYPLSTFVMLSPLVPLPWRLAGRVAAAVASLLVVLAIATLATDIPVAAPVRRYGFVILALMLEPLHTGINTGNLTVVTITCTAIGIWLALRQRPALGGVALGLGICFKPFVGIFALGYYVLARRWRVVIGATVSVAAIVAVGALRLHVAGTPWLSGYLDNNRMVLAGGGGGDIIQGATAGENGGRAHQFINLQFLGWLMFRDGRAAGLFALIVGAALVLSWVVLFVRADPAHPSLLELAALAVISLLPIYHRAYDAGLLLLPLLWALSDQRPETRGHRWLVLLLLVPFLVPAATAIDRLTWAGRLPQWLVDARWWSVVVVPHQVWALLAMAVVLLLADHRMRAVRVLS